MYFLPTHNLLAVYSPLCETPVHTSTPSEPGDPRITVPPHLAAADIWDNCKCYQKVTKLRDTLRKLHL